MLNSHGKPDISWCNTRRLLLLGAQLRVCSRGRVDRQAARVADIGDMVKEFQRVDELSTRFPAALEFKADESPVTSRPGTCPLARVSTRSGVRDR